CLRAIVEKRQRLSGQRFIIFFFQAEDGIRDLTVTGVQTCALPISLQRARAPPVALTCQTPAWSACRAHRCAPNRERFHASHRVRSEERRVGKEGRSKQSQDQ